jgi:DNA-directed RNA polymerase sigma subunit (sigma70/sigma32)
MTLCITKLRRAEVVLQERLKREPTPEKIAEVLGITASSEVGVTAR